MIIHLILLLVVSKCHGYDDGQDDNIVFDGPINYNYPSDYDKTVEITTKPTSAAQVKTTTEATVKTTIEEPETTEATETSVQSNNAEANIDHGDTHKRDDDYNNQMDDIYKKIRKFSEPQRNVMIGASPISKWDGRDIINGISISSLSKKVPNPLLWHVGIYHKGYTPYKQICGGSLVSPTAVISAAHCFWPSFSGQQPPEQYAVAAGKIYRAWDAFEENLIQKTDVIKITIPTRYLGMDTNFQHDLAILLVYTPFVITANVKPICINFDTNFDRYQLIPGTLGTIMGWGLTAENGTASPVLNFLELPYVDIGKCLANAKQDYRKYITADKICAGVKTGKAICRGDSGGGLAFFERPSHIPFLRGVASTSPNKANSLCNPEAISGFTHVQALKDFILDNIPYVEEECIKNYPTVAEMVYKVHGINLNGECIVNEDDNRSKDVNDNDKDNHKGEVNDVLGDKGNVKEINKKNDSCKQNNCVCNCNCPK